MGYALRPSDRDLTDALRRIAGEELAAAMAQLSGDLPSAGGVHDVRKRIKKLRGLLRLVRGGMKVARAEIAALRAAAQGLSGLRDAEVMLGWHDRLAPGVQGALRAHLAARVAAERADEAMPARVAAARAALVAVAGRVPGWRVKGRDAAVICAGVKRTLARGAAAMAAARESRDGEALHDWRKRVKDLWYQARLLSPIWPEGVAPWRTTADDLGEALGAHHDLAVFMAMAESLEGEAGAEATGLRGQALRLSAEIEAQAFTQGARLHAAPPEAVAGLWLTWWSAWQTAR